MSTAVAVVVCALNLLGRSPAGYPPIVVVNSPPAHASPNAQAFVNRLDGTIVLIASTAAFRDAAAAQETTRARGLCPARQALKLIASVLEHERWHLERGADEREAYLAQLMTLAMLGEGPGTLLHGSVRQAMAVTLKTRAQTPAWDRQLAAR